MDPQSEWLIACMWRPSPTVNEHGCWENEAFSHIDSAMAPDGYVPGCVRWTKPCAVDLYPKGPQP